MWDGWKKHSDTDVGKSYELLLVKDVGNLKVVMSLMVVLAKMKSELPGWKAQIITFNPGVGDYTLFDEVFPNLAEAEEKAWEKAQEIIRHYHQSISQQD